MGDGLAPCLLIFAAIAALKLLDGASWQIALWSALWSAPAALIGAWLCNVFYRFLAWRPGRPQEAAPSPKAALRLGRPE